MASGLEHRVPSCVIFLESTFGPLCQYLASISWMLSALLYVDFDMGRMETADWFNFLAGSFWLSSNIAGSIVGIRGQGVGNGQVKVVQGRDEGMNTNI